MVKKIMTAKNSGPDIPRRSFLSRIWIGLGLVALAEVFLGGIAFIVSGRKNEAKDSQSISIEAGSIADFSPGSVTFIHAANCYLSCLEDGGMLAISRKCTHLGCAVPWVTDHNQFECPCHASIFDNTGDVISSPAPRALDLYPISFEGDIVKIDISNSVKRAHFSAEQLAYAQELG